ncbi:MAG: heavy metal-binding domain-containing protein [Sciscionella sp.]
MADWDGRGLPPVARARVDRFASSGLRTSLLSVPGAVGVEAAGFTPVGEVMGCIVERVGFYSTLGMTVNDQLAPYREALRHGYAMALERLKLEAKGIGADGVVGIKLSAKQVGENTREFVALGSAVRAETRQRPGTLFTTELAGQDVGKLIQSGWVPATVAIGIGVLAYYSYNAQLQTTVWAGNTEVDAYTDLVTRVRANARKEFRQKVKASGADGAIVSRMSLSMWPLGDVALASVATVFGTAICQFHKGRTAPTSALTILPLDKQ